MTTLGAQASVTKLPALAFGGDAGDSAVEAFTISPEEPLGCDGVMAEALPSSHMTVSGEELISEEALNAPHAPFDENEGVSAAAFWPQVDKPSVMNGICISLEDSTIHQSHIIDSHNQEVTAEKDNEILTSPKGSASSTVEDKVSIPTAGNPIIADVQNHPQQQTSGRATETPTSKTSEHTSPNLSEVKLRLENLIIYNITAPAEEKAAINAERLSLIRQISKAETSEKRRRDDAKRVRIGHDVPAPPPDPPENSRRPSLPRNTRRSGPVDEGQREREKKKRAREDEEDDWDTETLPTRRQQKKVRKRELTEVGKRMEAAGLVVDDDMMVSKETKKKEQTLWEKWKKQSVRGSPCLRI